MLRRRWLQILTGVWLVLGIAATIWIGTRTGLVKASGDCTHPLGQPVQQCFSYGHPYSLLALLVFGVTVLGAAVMWGQGTIRAWGQFPPSAKPPRVNSGMARD